MQHFQNTTTRFSDRVEDYVKFRPGYPNEVLQFFSDELGLTRDSVIVDVGSGTGIFSELFLRNGNTVYAVEPNLEMRKTAEVLLSKYPNFKSVGQTAENTGLPNAIADFVTAAQAFHWFDIEKTRNEFGRLLKPGGYVGLIWNIRNYSGSRFQTEYDELIATYGTDYERLKHGGSHHYEDISKFFGAENYKAVQFENSQEFDFEGLVGRVTSNSYMPNRQDPKFPLMRSDLERLFEKFQTNGKVKFRYDTNLYFAKLPSCNN